MGKWMIFQNVIVTPLIAALGVLLKADWKLYSLDVSETFVFLKCMFCRMNCFGLILYSSNSRVW